MERSYNDWTASRNLQTRVIEPVRGCRLRIRDNQNVADIFTYLVREFHNRVDDVTKPHPADDWGFAYRPNRNNPNSLSCHASGTAIDLDATEHPNRVATSRTFTPRQIAEVHEILRELDGTVRWGGDYTQTADAMHFEIIARPGGLQAIGRKIRRGQLKKSTTSVPDTRVQNFLEGGPQWDVRILDRAVQNGRRDVASIVRGIDNAVNRLPNDRDNSLVRQFKEHYKRTRVLRMGLLNRAVSNGRRGTVKMVRDDLQNLIHKKLPRK